MGPVPLAQGAGAFGEGVPQVLGRGCQGWHGGRGQRHGSGSGNHRALRFVFSSPAANRLTDPALRICFGKGGTGGVTSGKLHLGQLYFRAGFRSSSSPFFFFFPPTSLSSPFNFSISFPNGSLGDSQPRAAPKGGLTPSPPSQVRSATERARAPLPSLGTGNVPSPPVLRPLSTDPCVFPSAS